MADTPDTPAYGSTRTVGSRPASRKSASSARSKPSSRTTEETPLLQRRDSEQEEANEDEGLSDTHPRSPAASSLLRSLSTSGETEHTPKAKRRWPSLVALLILCVVVILIMVLGFVVPHAVEEYAMQAVDFKPTRLALDELTKAGMRVRVEGDFKMDASRVKKKSVRNLGRFSTWVAKEAETGPADVDIYLPEYGNVLVGKAKVPGIKVNIRNGRTTHVDVLADLEPGSFDGLRTIVDDYLEGRLGKVSVKGRAKVPLRSGIFRLGEQIIEQSVALEGNELPAIPEHEITRLNFRKASQGKGMGADVTVVVQNDYSVDFTIPSIMVDVLMNNCAPTDPYIEVGHAISDPIHILPKSDVQVNATGDVRKLPEALTAACPSSSKSPLDAFLGSYIHGEDTTIYVKCCSFPDPATPQWARDLAIDITVPVPLHGHTFDNLIKNFSLTETHFFLPELLADPDTPEAQPRISAKVKVLVGLPKEMNFPLDVTGIRADADVYYHKQKFGKLDLSEWQKANSTRIEAHGDESAALLVDSNVEKVPLIITDDDVFSDVVQALIFGGSTLFLSVKADVDVEMETPIGKFAVREIPADGIVPIKPVTGGGGLGSFRHEVGNLQIVDTTDSSITFQADVNFTNPTNYTATIPYVNINILNNNTVLGHAIIKNVTVVPGNNTNVVAQAVWDPKTSSGENGTTVGRELLSQYISGYNTTLTLKMHKDSVPSQPALGKALSQFQLTVPFPKLRHPKKPSDGDDDDDGDDDAPHFIKGTTMHLLTSTAVFALSSPFTHTTLYLTHLNATASYRGHPAGRIDYALPFAVPPGSSESPRLPVDWEAGGLGYEAIRKALGGELKLDARAQAGVRIGMWREEVWVVAKGVGAKVRL